MKKLRAILAISFALFMVPILAMANAGDFSGGVAIGTGYAGVDAAPSNGAIIQGNVGIGNTSPGALLDVGSAGATLGAMRLDGSTSGYIQLQPAGTAGSWTMTLPANAGTNGYVLQTDGTGVTSWVSAGGGGGSSINSNGQLQSGSSTTLSYCPYKGNLKTLAGSGSYTIPSTCLTATITSMYVGGTASQSLSANTLYYIYLWNNSGTVVLDAETTGHATNTTNGVEQMSDDATKTLVGMVYPQTGPVLSDNSTARLVATWDNRTPKYLANGFSTTRTTTSTTAVEINSEIRGLFLTWGDSFNASYYGNGEITNGGHGQFTEITLDGTSTLIASSEYSIPSGNWPSSLNASGNFSTSEGEHYITITGYVGASGVTGNWYITVSPKGLTWAGII